MIGSILYPEKYESFNSLYVFFGQSFLSNALIYILSILFCFCAWHRILILSMSFVLLMEALYNIGVQMNYYAYIALLIVTLSMLAATYIYANYGCYNKKAVKNRIKTYNKKN